MVNEIELAWAAGFFDGEGCVNIHYNHRYVSITMRLLITQKNREVLDRFRKATGRVGIIIGPHGGNSECFKLSVHNENAINVFNKIKPYLSRIKIEQGDKAIDEYRRYLSCKVTC